MPVTLTDQDKNILRTAAYGAVTLISAADATGEPHKAAAEGSIALASATGLVGHVLAEYPRDMRLDSTSVAAIADQVLPALTTAMGVLKHQDPAEADNFRSAVLVAVETATRGHRGQPGPALAAMTRKITAALDAA
ncbi:hypothetical protein F4553_000232 [Allocatelliglobosispora scoriae]|uniref:Uncharacterized protein n=1 Tax=Allocatelliglobosispora scoriae TaxID=643052 RepID=A0A841BIG3_9ACTN|nr:hypothetical protein [Allocatelliglobosispora scoriae]MBB5866853.1 hypothetical protein [Allocatelliglobosispora scoriae]